MTRSLSALPASTALAYALTLFFFFNDTATTEIYTLSLHDALPISCGCSASGWRTGPATCRRCASTRDRKSTRLNSSHDQISYAVFCLKKKKECGFARARPRPGGADKTHGCVDSHA